MKTKTFTILLLGLLLAGGVLSAQTTKIPWDAANASGAGTTAAGTRVLYSSFGQPMVGVSTAGTRVLNSGYLYIRAVPQGAPFLVTQSSVNFGNVIVGMNTTQNLTIQNSGGAPLVISSTDLPGGEFAIASGGGPQTIPAGGSVNLLLRFAPASPGNKSATLTINSNASNGASITVALSGMGVATAPILQISAVSLDFGSVTVGFNTIRVVTIANTGNANLTIGAQSVTGADAGMFTITHPCGGTIAPGGSDYIEITFAPASAGGKNATLVFTSNDAGNPSVNVTLAGVGAVIAQPHITLSAATIDFGTTPPGSPVTRNLVISNTGGAALNLTSQLVSGGGFALTAPAGGTIAPGGNSTATLTFTPPSAGSFNGDFDIASDDPSNPFVTVDLHGVGGTPGGPRISLSSNILDFGNVPVLAVREQTLTISNIGAGDLVISGQSISGTAAFEFSIQQPASTPIPAGGNTTARIGHHPTSWGPKVAHYLITSNDPGSPVFDVLLASVATGVERLDAVPTGVRLHQNYPNPFNPSTTLIYEIDKPAMVSIAVLDSRGRMADVIENISREAGVYRVSYDASRLAAGTYLVLMRTTSGASTAVNSVWMTLLK